MKLVVFCLIALVALFLDLTSGQNPSDAALKFDVTLVKSPPSITIKWAMAAVVNYNFTGTSFSVYRTDPTNMASFGSPVKTIPFVSYSTYSYTDTNVEVGIAYEYRVVSSASGAQIIEGLAIAGIELPLVESRGNVLLVVEQQAWNNMTTELNQLKMDLIGDGWNVSSIIVDKTNTAKQVKAKIVSALGTNNSSTLFVFGSVAVPYSGQMNPDGHSNHVGAWPADVYYTSLTESVWVDKTVNDNSSTDARNWNWPGDGKFDVTNLAYSGIPSEISTLEIGRVDLSRFTGQDEMALLRKYLVKDHGYRHRDPEYTFAQRGVVNDGFGWFSSGEAFAVTGWRLFSSVVGKANVVAGNLFTTLGNTSAIWAFGTGGGSFTSASSVGSTSDFLTKPMRAAFTMLFGSYFIDWDSANNFLRAPLAGSHALTSISSGRPHAIFHHMGVGYHTGFCARQTQANYYKYVNAGYYRNYIHQNLMGDPTLRMYMVDPPTNVALQSGTSNGVGLMWQASSDTVEGYHVYRSASSIEGPYTRITQQLVTSTSYVDTSAVTGTNYYMVRAIQLTQTPTATFFNPSQAAFFQTNYVPPVQSPSSASQTPSTSNGPAGAGMISGVRETVPNLILGFASFLAINVILLAL